MRSSSGQVRPCGYFLSHYIVLPDETTTSFGSGQLQLAPTRGGKSAVEAVEGVVGRFVCSEFLDGKQGVPKSERKNAPQREVRRVVTRFVHKTGALSSEDPKLVQQLIDQAAPEVRLWHHIGEAVAAEKSSLCLHPLLECWVEVEASAAIPQSPLHSMERTQWSEEGDAELQHDLEESTCAVYMVLSLVDPATRPTIAAQLQAKVAWSTEDIYLVLHQLVSFVRLVSAFNRKGQRRKGNEGTFLLDIDPTRVHVTVDAPNMTPTSGGSVTAVTFSMDCITTASRSGTEIVPMSPSVVLAQSEFDPSLWQRVRFVGRSAKDVPKGCSEDSTTSTVAIAGQKATMFLVGLLMLRLTMVSTFETLAVRFFPGNSKPPYFTTSEGQLVHDSTLRSVVLQLIDPEDVNRPGASQVLESIFKDEHNSLRSRRASLASSRRSTFVGSASVVDSEAMSLTMRSSTAPSPVKDKQSPTKRTPPDSRKAANSPTRAAAHPALVQPAAATDRDLAAIFSHSQKHKAVHAKQPATKQTPRGTTVDSNKPATPCSSNRLPHLKNNETPFEEHRRQMIAKYLEAAALGGDDSSWKRHAKLSLEVLESVYYKGWAAAEVQPHRVGAEQLSALPTPPSSSPNSKHGRPAHHHGHNQGNTQLAYCGTPASSVSTRKTAETPANDTKPSPCRSAPTTTAVMPLTPAFVL